ncbi:MAG TPA: pilus assembly protein TadG-related protein [Dehalococcoidia bacterium]|nr:pilus assembly protein TadG-related protein [Dehalococcoidia bacterium]
MAGVIVSKRERGQVFIAAALLLPVLLGMSALAVDLGSYAGERRSLQNSADAIALAAAQDLPDATAAQATAQTWATKNGVSLSNLTVTIGGGNTSPQVSVSITKPHAFAFIGALGVGPQNVGAKAVAAKFSPGAIGGLMPWAITQATVDATAPGQPVTIKYGAGGGTTGNYGAIDIDGNGANTYRSTIEHGAQGVVCSSAMPNCSPSSCPGPNCAENAQSCTGPQCPSEPGNMVGPTDQGVQYRLDHTTAACSSFSSVFTPNGSGYNLTPACNPWSAGACPQPDNGAACSRRVIVIPIVDQFGNGKKPVTVLGFALLWLDSSSGGVVTGRFVNANVDMGALTGGYDPNSLIHFAKLIQ